MEPESDATESTDTAGEGAPPSETESGRYIPYSGGSAGWFENSGVLKSEQSNNYLFRVEMDRPEVRSRQFERWGPAFDRRGDPRKRHRLPINVVTGELRLALTTWDVNTRGVRLQLGESPNLTEGQQVQVELLDVPEGRPILTVEGQVVWMQESGLSQKVWNVGIYFPSLTADDAAQMNAQLGI